MRAAMARAPASVANLTVGFDVLGVALDGPFDVAMVERREGGGEPVRIVDLGGEDAGKIPREPERNSAGAALLALHEELGPSFGLDLSLVKGIPCSAGMGGSAASAVAAVVAAAALFEPRPGRERLLAWATAGEAAVAGSPHPDNVAPALWGGATLVVDGRVVALPLPDRLACALVKPDLEVRTREARADLPDRVSLAIHARQSARLAAFALACARGDLDLLARSLRDEAVEPCRARRIPGFQRACDAALAAGALGVGVAGSGPSLYALAEGLEAAAAAADAIAAALRAEGLDSITWTSGLPAAAARLLVAA